jgi:translation initiation factor 3 subunit G
LIVCSEDDGLDGPAGGRKGGDQQMSTSDGVYKPPYMRGNANSSTPAGGMGSQAPGITGSRKYDSGKDEFTIRVTNLPEETIENDLMELFNPFGKVNRIFLAKDKNTQASRGFAFVNFQRKEDAQRAIWGVNDFGYHHLILKVEWAKPSKDS